MNYEVKFDFTIVKPKKSQFIGKSGVINITTDRQMSDEELDDLKRDNDFLRGIIHELNTSLKQKNVFMVTVKTITPCQNKWVIQ